MVDLLWRLWHFENRLTGTEGLFELHVGKRSSYHVLESPLRWFCHFVKRSHGQNNRLAVLISWTLSLPSSRSTFSQPFRENCINYRYSESWLRITIFHLSALWKAVWCYISGEAAREIWNWSLLGMKGLMSLIKCVSCLFFNRMQPKLLDDCHMQSVLYTMFELLSEFHWANKVADEISTFYDVGGIVGKAS